MTLLPDAEDDVIARIHAVPPRDVLPPMLIGCRTCGRVISRGTHCEECVPSEQLPELSEHDAAIARERRFAERIRRDRH